MKICIWDDDADAAAKWQEQLDAVLSDKVATVHAASADEITNDIRVLHERRKAYLKSDTAVDGEKKCGLDDTQILIVDNDLFELPELNDLSAETVASRAGVYTDCAYIVVLNLNPDVDFDLTLLGHPSSKADLHINDRCLGDTGLWTQCPKEDGAFRPWHWSLLLSAAELYKSRTAELGALLQTDDRDMPILEFLGFGEAPKRRLSRMARAFLHPTGRAERTSFMDFVAGNTRAVNKRDGEQMAARADVAKIARIGARRISKWLARYVVGPQDILIDLPHLIERMPFVVPKQERRSADFWNSCARLCKAPVGLVEATGITRFQAGSWVDRPVFWTEGIETEENVERLLAIPDGNPCGFVFCEDSSSFHDADACDAFLAGHNSMSDRRFVRWLANDQTINYGPQSRLAM